MRSKNERAILLFAPVALAALAGLSPLTAHACHQEQVCMDFLLEPDDDEFGSISFEPAIPAAGLRVTIFRPFPEPPLGMYLGDDGCVSFDTQFNAGHTIQFYPEALVGDPAGTTYNIRVKTFQSVDDSLDNVEKPTVVLVPPIADGNHIFNLVEPGVGTFNGGPDNLASILAISTSMLRRLHSMPGSPLSDGAELKLFRSVAANGSLWFPDTIRLGRDSGNEKFLIGHEIGHWLQSVRARQLSTNSTYDGYWNFNYDYVPVVEECQFTSAANDDSSNSHGIRSAEISSGAMPEGFAHFVASVAFNTLPREDAAAPEGIFRYYKDISLASGTYDDFVDPDQDNYRVALDGGATAVGGASRWVELQCDPGVDMGDWDTSQDYEITSEIDWVRFYWAFLNADVGATPEPDFWDVVELMTYTQVNYGWTTSFASPLWQNLLNTVGDQASGLGSYQGRMEPLRLANGVFNDAN